MTDGAGVAWGRGDGHACCLMRDGAAVAWGEGLVVHAACLQCKKAACCGGLPAHSKNVASLWFRLHDGTVKQGRKLDDSPQRYDSAYT